MERYACIVVPNKRRTDAYGNELIEPKTVILDYDEEKVHLVPLVAVAKYCGYNGAIYDLWGARSIGSISSTGESLLHCAALGFSVTWPMPVNDWKSYTGTPHPFSVPIYKD